jgi:hypothetical protein
MTHDLIIHEALIYGPMRNINRYKNQAASRRQKANQRRKGFRPPLPFHWTPLNKTSNPPMETTPAAACEEIRPSDLRSTALSESDKLPIEERDSVELPLNPDNEKQRFDPVQNSTADTNQLMNTDLPPSESIQMCTPEPTEVINSEKRKREEAGLEEETSNPENKKQNSSSNPLWKTSLCSYYRRHSGGGGEAGCSHGATCRYAHGEAELRPRPDNTWDPTSSKAKEMVKADKKEKNEEIEVEVQLTLDESSLDKCLIGLPRKWANDALKKFLEEKVNFQNYANMFSFFLKKNKS